MIGRSRPLQLLSLTVVVVAALSLVSLTIALAGFDVSTAARAALDGAFGGSFAIFSATLKRTTPLLFLGVAVAVAFRAGVLNIGAEGQFLAGAAAAAAVGLHAPVESAVMMLPLEFAAAATAGMGWAAIAAWLKARFGVTEVVSTLLLNFVAINAVGFLVRGPLQEPTFTYPQTLPLGESARLPLLVDSQRLHWGFVIALLVAIGAWWVFQNTAAGFRARISGISRSAAESAGLIAVGRVQASALLASGAIAGIAGFSEVAGVTYRLYEGLSPGYGYTAIAVALLGRLHPIGIIASAVLFGALGSGADSMQRNAGIPAEFASVLAAVILLGVLALPAAEALLARKFRVARAL
ncbi:MAG: ABC transporter permease [Gemmatimonadetes bacterium]|nr:ABC transporter permease [Gemmatimonadota bacterium]